MVKGCDAIAGTQHARKKVLSVCRNDAACPVPFLMRTTQ